MEKIVRGSSVALFFSKLIFRYWHLVCFFNLRIFDHYRRNKEDAFCAVYGFNVGVGCTATPVEPCVVPDLVKPSQSLSIHRNKTFSRNNITGGAYSIFIQTMKPVARFGTPFVRYGSHCERHGSF